METDKGDKEKRGREKWGDRKEEIRVFGDVGQ